MAKDQQQLQSWWWEIHVPVAVGFAPLKRREILARWIQTSRSRLLSVLNPGILVTCKNRAQESHLTFILKCHNISRQRWYSRWWSKSFRRSRKTGQKRKSRSASWMSSSGLARRLGLRRCHSELRPWRVCPQCRDGQTTSEVRQRPSCGLWAGKYL